MSTTRPRDDFPSHISDVPRFPSLTGWLSGATTATWNKMKRAFKNKQPSDPYIKTVKIFSSYIGDYVEAKMRLDTGCEVHNLITYDAVQRLYMSRDITFQNLSICTCLNGEQLISQGTLVLRWKGKSFRKIFTTVFHVIDGDNLPWDVILGAETIHKHGILKLAGFGGTNLILPQKTTEEKEDAAARRQVYQMRAAANDAKVNEDIKAKEEAARQARSNIASSSSRVNSGYCSQYSKIVAFTYDTSSICCSIEILSIR